MAKSPAKDDKPRKTYAVSFNKELMLELQHAALDDDRHMNELLEEATRDFLKKRKEKKGK